MYSKTKKNTNTKQATQLKSPKSNVQTKTENNANMQNTHISHQLPLTSECTAAATLGAIAKKAKPIRKTDLL